MTLAGCLPNGQIYLFILQKNLISLLTICHIYSVTYNKINSFNRSGYTTLLYGPPCGHSSSQRGHCAGLGGTPRHVQSQRGAGHGQTPSQARRLRPGAGVCQS